MVENTLSGNLERIKAATDSIRTITDTTNDTIEDVVQAVSDLNDESLAKDQEIADLEDEIERITPKGTITITNNGTVNVSSYANANVALTPEAFQKVVFFFDCDGSILYSYSKSEFLNLTELPANTTYPGLTAIGWSWTLAEAKTYINTHKTLYIGQVYTPTDADIRLVVNLKGELFLMPKLNFTYSGTVTIDWGDGVINTNTLTHTYDECGIYTISISSSSSISLQANKSIIDAQDTSLTYGLYKQTLLKLYLSSKIGTMVSECIIDYPNLEILVLPYNATELGTGINGYIKNCPNIKTITVPYVTKTAYGAIWGCANLKYVSMPKLVNIGPYGFQGACILEGIDCIPTRVGYNAFQGCTYFSDIDLSAVTSIEQSAFLDCFSLKKINAPVITSIGNSAFENCKNLQYVNLPEVTGIGNNAFKGDINLQTINVPKLLTIGQGAFQNCKTLSNITTLVNLTTIPAQPFMECWRLGELNLPNVTTLSRSAFAGDRISKYILPKVTSIGDYVFNSCKQTEIINLTGIEIIPSATNNSFNGLPSFTKIIVPDVLYEDIKTATGWSNVANQIIKTSDYEGGNE